MWTPAPDRPDAPPAVPHVDKTHDTFFDRADGGAKHTMRAPKNDPWGTPRCPSNP
jgi:hypothetical protein